MNDKHYDFRNETGTYQTGRTQPPKRHTGLIAFLLVLVILLSGISTALSIMNLKLYRKLTIAEQSAPVAFSRSGDPTPTEAVHEEVKSLQEHLGISGTIIPEVYQRYYKLPGGIYVSRVADNSEAKEKGVVVGDIITVIGGNPVRDDMLLNIWAKGLEVGDTVPVTLYHSGSEVELTLTWSDFD